MSKLQAEFREIRKVSTPWCVVRTTDYMATIKSLLAVRTNGVDEPPPAALWTCVDGVTSPVTSPLGEVWSKATPAWATADDPPFIMLKTAKEALPEEGILFMVCPDATVWTNAFTIQAAAQLRDVFKSNRRTLVILGTNPVMPEFLREDVPVLEDPLPDEGELTSAVQSLCENVGLPTPPNTVQKAAAMCLGMTRFAAEEAVARKLRKSGIDFAGLAEAQKSVIEASSNKALTFEKERWTFDEVGGLTAFKEFMGAIFSGPKKPALIVRVDEIDKSITAASSGQVADNTGVSQDILKCLLTALEDNKWMGLLAVGGPGCLRGDTPIFDPVDGTTKNVRVRFIEGKRFHVISWDEENKRPIETLAMPPRCFKRTEMIEFTLENGSVFAVTPEHLFWNGIGYVAARRIAQLLALSEEVRLPSHSGIIPLKVTKARWVKPAAYFDFHVPIHNNYMACGIFHHNTGKTLASICTGNQFGTRTLALDLGAVKGSLVGETEGKIRRVVDILKSIGGENVLFMATANRLDTMPPELQRRFWLGTWFWDLPDAKERAKIWEIQLSRFGLDPKRCTPMPNDDNWTGSDIRNACQMAWVCGSTLAEAAQRITVAGVSSRAQIETLRTLAETSGFRSANKVGPYARPKASGRKVNL